MVLPVVLLRLNALKVLGADIAGLHLASFAPLAGCSLLATLQLHNCTLGPGLEHVTTLTSLQLLSCNTEGMRRPLMATLASLPALEHLAMDCLDYGAVHGRSVLSGIAQVRAACSFSQLDCTPPAIESLTHMLRAAYQS